jgi:hypothetical protein
MEPFSPLKRYGEALAFLLHCHTSPVNDHYLGHQSPCPCVSSLPWRDLVGDLIALMGEVGPLGEEVLRIGPQARMQPPNARRERAHTLCEGGVGHNWRKFTTTGGARTYVRLQIANTIMWHNVVWIGGIWLVALVFVWLICHCPFSMPTSQAVLPSICGPPSRL